MSNHIETVQRWCLKADNDLKNACHEIEHEDPALDTICFHSQQTAEKYLKAFLVFSDTEIPKTHFLSDSSETVFLSIHLLMSLLRKILMN